MYEGDTERMLIKSVLNSKEFELLRSQYVSFVQVGGAYAHNYKPIIDFLGTKTVLITDLDYDKDSSIIADILKSGTTNAAINHFAEIGLNDKSPTVQALFEWQAKAVPTVIGNICLAFQGKSDGYSRTLEEAMLAKHYKTTALEVKLKEEWSKLREKDKLKYTIPRARGECSIHTIVLHTSNRKTDFMYSVILNGMVDSMLPAYVKEALLWLTK
jgi:predicted ATP-dependent endonuclease of OLD family